MTAANNGSTVVDLCNAMEQIAPVGLAQNWDNVGLLAGDPSANLNRILLCIDLTTEVLDEAIDGGSEAIVAYHPPLFKPVRTLRADSTGTDAIIFRCIANGVAIYAPHTALDAADGGTNDVLAAMCDIQETLPLEYVDQPGPREHKLVVFVPADDADRVAEAMFACGAGHIGDYRKCSFRTAGTGTFHAPPSCTPTVGKSGRLENVDEVRLETVVSAAALPAVVSAMMKAHAYEEPAFDILPLSPKPARGIGRIGMLPKPIALDTLAKKLKKKTDAATVQIVGPASRSVDRAIIVAGAAGSLPFGQKLTESDVVITGEIRHHDALTILRTGSTAIALGHWSSERPVLVALAEKLRASLPSVRIAESDADQDPFQSA